MTLANDYDTDLAGRSYSRLYREESAIAFSAIDCVLNAAKGVYASSELTTGTRAYARLREHGFRSMHELDDAGKHALLGTNIDAAAAFARQLRERLPHHALVITPGPFVAPGWTQAEYLTFWETLIRTRVHAVYFNAGWEYSNGCTFEFAVAREQGLPTFDAALRPLAAADGCACIAHAVADLAARGFDPHRLQLNLDRARRAEAARPGPG